MSQSTTSEKFLIYLYGILNPGSRTNAWSIGQCSASVSAVVMLKTSTNFEYIAGMKFPSLVGILLSAASDLH